MRILVMGAGAMGSVVGGFMAKAGHNVTLVGRAEHMDAVARHGLHITGIWGDHRVANLHTDTAVHHHTPGAYDLILVTVKSYDTARAVGAIEPVADGNTLVCSYQNGLGNAETIAAAVGWERTVGARAIFGSRILQPGEAEVTVIASPTALGVHGADGPAGRVWEVVEAMDNAGVPTVFTEHIASVLWGKVAYNCALNPLSALLDVPYGALAENAYSRSIMRETVEELYAVATALEVKLDPPDAGSYYTHLIDVLIPPTAAHYASMREDFLHRRRTEIDALNGAIVRYAEEKGMPAPVNSLLTRLVHAREHALGVDDDT